MSIKGNIFRLLSNQLKTKLTFDQSLPGALPSVKWIDKYNSQILKTSPDPAIQYPAIFIQFSTFKWTTANNKVQKGAGIIRLHVAFENHEDSQMGAVNQDKALQFLEFNEAVFNTMEGFSGKGFTALSRITDKEDIDHSSIIVTMMDYQTQLLDDSADEAKNQQLADPELIVIRGKETIAAGNTADNFIL
jgi:hypothetical protein